MGNKADNIFVYNNTNMRLIKNLLVFFIYLFFYLGIFIIFYFYFSNTSFLTQTSFVVNVVPPYSLYAEIGNYLRILFLQLLPSLLIIRTIILILRKLIKFGKIPEIFHLFCGTLAAPLAILIGEIFYFGLKLNEGSNSFIYLARGINRDQLFNSPMQVIAYSFVAALIIFIVNVLIKFIRNLDNKKL